MANPTTAPQSLEAPTTALEALFERSWRLGVVIEQSSRRRDVRDVRAKILGLLLALRCPPGVIPVRSWYVPGAVARRGPTGLSRAWEGFWGEAPPSTKTIRKHLGELERLCTLVRQPGEALPYHDPAHPERRPRYPDTIHLLDDEESALWWARRGLAILEAHPELRRNATAWRRELGGWRQEARSRQLELFGEVSPQRSTQGRREATRRPALARDLRAAIARRVGPLELLSLMARHGSRVAGRASWGLAEKPSRLLGAAALLARALERGDRIRKPAAWLLVAARHAPPSELAEALIRPPQPSPRRPR